MESNDHTTDLASHAPGVEAAPIAEPTPPLTGLAEGAVVMEGASHPKMAAAEQSEATATESPPSPHSTGEAKTQNALAALMSVLDSDEETARRGSISLRSLQKMCMRVPQLSNELTRPQRFQLYCLLLLEDSDDPAVPGGAAGQEDWTTYTKRALETHVHVAKQAAALFPTALHITTDELAGLFYRLGADATFYFNPVMMEVILCVTYVVAGSRSTDKNMLLRTLYRMLCVLQKDFIASAASHLYEPATTSLLRLMLQFYDPQLATHMDQQQVNIGTYLFDWSRRLLVLQSDYDTALKVLDWVLILGDPVMVPYVAHAYLITHRRSLMLLSTKQALTQHLDKMKFTLPACKADAIDPELVDGRATAPTPVWGGKSLLQNADLLYRVTPLSTQRILAFCLYPDVGVLNKTPKELQEYYAKTPSLPLERSDIASAFAKRGAAAQGGGDALPSHEYIIVDCRSQESFEYVRLPTAVHVGDVLSYRHEDLAEALRRLESCRGHPLALFGTGRPIVEETNLLKVFALYLVNRQAFPFVCIVPGGFKTTIPLIRNRIIDAIMSPAAAAALENATGKWGISRIDWGQQASKTAHTISAALNEVSGYLAQVEGAEVRQKAQELGTKAKEGVAAAGSWGWGMMKRVRESLSETSEQALTALSSVSGKIAAAQITTTAISGSAPSSAAETGPSSATAPSGASKSSTSGQAVIPTAIAHPTAVRPSQQPQQVFSLGEDCEEEDLDLITSIPARPLRGTVVPEPAPVAAEMALSAPAAASSAAVVSAPERRHLTAPASSPAVTVAAASLEPVPPPTSSAAPVAATAARGASAPQIAADLDAEFDELFGDLTVTPAAASRVAGLSAAEADGLP
ncbi:Rab-GTPase-TBC domain containing protein, putative [Leishmania donovani]|uniref:TBC1 domain family member 23 n=1 Tax=Leishmania donovani TaxID=5661 RepID=A0A3Q8IGR4_LEIDO|nr:Rab-GTPase-TBC domain containing protein, putative [Leishmania donovani]